MFVHTQYSLAMTEHPHGKHLREEEARYEAIQLVKQHPALGSLLVDSRGAGLPWNAILDRLGKEVTKLAGLRQGESRTRTRE